MAGHRLRFLLSDLVSFAKSAEQFIVEFLGRFDSHGMSVPSGVVHGDLLDSRMLEGSSQRKSNRHSFFAEACDSGEANSHHERYSRLGGRRRHWSAFANESSEACE